MKKLSISLFILVLIISFSVKDVQAVDEGPKVFSNIGYVITYWWGDEFESFLNTTAGVNVNFRLNKNWVLSPEIYLLTGGPGSGIIDHLWIVPSVLLNYKRKTSFFAGLGFGYFLKVVFEHYPDWGSQKGFFIKFNIGFRGWKKSFTLFYAYRLEGYSDERNSFGGTIGFGI